MQVPVEVTFRDMPVSDAVEAACWDEAAKLERYYDRITSCRIVVAESHRRQQKGNLFEIRIDLEVPGRALVVNRGPSAHHRDEDIYVAIREAFDSARRQLEDYVRRQRAQVKLHEVPPHGTVTKIKPEEDYGFIATPEGREIYFHRNSVCGDGFDRLEIGSQVRFVESGGVEGPQATSVTPVGRHHHLPPGARPEARC
ncbi:MAG: HPF/RaiA family ribosome-associated protein [Planctomycetota bacterium]|jgi:ribosomal subunit interface protein